MAVALPKYLLKNGRLPVNTLYLSQCNFSALCGGRRPFPADLPATEAASTTTPNLTSNRWSPGQPPRHWSTVSVISCRFGSNRSLPTVMQFPNIIWPSVIKTIKNWIMVNFIIKPYFDQDFDMSEFAGATKHALEIVSTSMSSGNIKRLNGLVSDEALTELEATVNRMSVAQRNEISVIKDDIYLSFPYQVGIMFDEKENELQKRWVEITMVFHVLRGLRDMRDKGIVPPLNIGLNPEYRDRISICNYRFIKEFTQGHESDWTINVANHFKPADLIEE